MDDGQLVPRNHPDAMVHGSEASYAHVRRMLDEGAIVSVGGTYPAGSAASASTEMGRRLSQPRAICANACRLRVARWVALPDLMYCLRGAEFVAK